MPPDAVVKTRTPEDRLHVPLVPNQPEVEVTAKLLSPVVGPVCDPVSPVMVTLDPVARLESAVSETVNVLSALDTGVLCRIDLRVNCCAPTATILIANPMKKSTLSSFRKLKLFRFFEDVWSIKLTKRK
jgi:hypothetical protein